MGRESSKLLMNGKSIDRALSRIAHEILEKDRGAGDLVLIGVCQGGVPLAEILKDKILDIEEVDVPSGYIDITRYRDELSCVGYSRELKKTEIPCSIDNRVVVLVDDVLFTGRTIRAAMDALIDFGRPRAVQLAILVDRGHRELPIRADYVGRNVPTSRNEIVDVDVAGKVEEWSVTIREMGEDER